MCGIAGFINLHRNIEAPVLKATAARMVNTLSHRGPDSSGIWSDEAAGVALGHRRLAIVDLSQSGHQPMVSATGRYIITFNGEIYNFLLIKDRLFEKGHRFKGASDTEVLLAAIEEWGLARALSEISGMFAFAVWDRKEEILSLARDRVGKKPLYYGWTGKVFLFGSELKALRAHPDFVADIDRDALAAYTRHNYVPAPWSIYKGISKLPAATFLSIHVGKKKEEGPIKYWDFRGIAETGCKNPISLSDSDAIQEMDDILSQAVRQRMISDVPLGCFLSGGIDSSLIAALMQKNSSVPARTFSIGFAEATYDESQGARRIAGHLGTEHMEFILTSAEMQEAIPSLPLMFDEPFADSSQIPTWHVAKFARQHVTVALSGDGGDESFGGYDRYQIANKISPVLFSFPKTMRDALSGVLRKTPATGRARKFFEIMNARDPDDFYRLMMAYWKIDDHILVQGCEPLFTLNDPAQIPNIDDYISRMMSRDTLSYLPDDILVKVDRASMAASLEARAPLLDRNVIEFAWSLPMSMKIRDGERKWILRKVLERYVPRSMFDRPKQGFSIPVGEWLRGPLLEWAESLLAEERLNREGFFHAPLIRRRWQQHLSGHDDWSYHLWGILMFQAWNETWNS